VASPSSDASRPLIGSRKIPSESNGGQPVRAVTKGTVEYFAGLVDDHASIVDIKGGTVTKRTER
jgi:hypothetical protein